MKNLPSHMVNDYVEGQLEIYTAGSRVHTSRGEIERIVLNVNKDDVGTLDVYLRCNAKFDYETSSWIRNEDLFFTKKIRPNSFSDLGLGRICLCNLGHDTFMVVFIHKDYRQQLGFPEIGL